jgi:hypothetical protein
VSFILVMRQVCWTVISFAWNAGRKLCTEQVWNLRPGNDGQLIYRASECSSLQEVISEGFLSAVGDDRPSYHRVAVFDFDESR